MITTLFTKDTLFYTMDKFESKALYILLLQEINRPLFYYRPILHTSLTLKYQLGDVEAYYLTTIFERKVN
ncbi:hypothetical protein C3744_00290 [Priestia megaterium]|uniref:Uncharacterized protein n=1 Tax=Priestia megaterium TaxID=1404 RepID=A0A3D8XAL1_PRIMG|nr:hypothetical protein C3744_00290 [Priestia megaterium]